MDLKYQSLILITLILASLTLTQLNSPTTSEAISNVENQPKQQATSSTDFLGYQSASISNIEKVKKAPIRKWDVLDPEIKAEVALVHSLDDDPGKLFYKNTHQNHVLASLTKLITSVVVLEEISPYKTIPISAEAVDNPWRAGNLKSGQVYNNRELLKLMLLTSSNDAANAFEEYFGGKEAFVEIANKKMEKIGMDETVIHDGSGLNDNNRGTADDFLKLSKYILKNHPKVFTWTRSSRIRIQPIKSGDENVETRTELNINSLVDNKNYLGGKTGTSQAAGQNLVAKFNAKDRRILVILMGAENREAEALKLIEWMKNAYNFNN